MEDVMKHIEEKVDVDNLQLKSMERSKAIEDLQNEMHSSTGSDEILKKVKDLNVEQSKSMDKLKESIEIKFIDFDKVNSNKLQIMEEIIKSNNDKINILDQSSKYTTEQVINLFQSNTNINEKMNDLCEKENKNLKTIEGQLTNII